MTSTTPRPLMQYLRSAAVVFVAMYLPSLILWLAEPNIQKHVLLFLPGTLAAIPAHHNEALQTGFAAAGSLVLLITLTLFGSKSHGQLAVAAGVAFLNSLLFAALTWFILGLAGSGAFAAP